MTIPKIVRTKVLILRIYGTDYQIDESVKHITDEVCNRMMYQIIENTENLTEDIRRIAIDAGKDIRGSGAGVGVRTIELEEILNPEVRCN